MTAKLLAGIETGGTKIVCAVAHPDAPELIRTHTTILTGEAVATTSLIAQFLRVAAPHGLAGMGLASFGPIDPDPASPTYGYITSSPKRGWADFDLVGALTEQIDPVPVAFVTDVIGAAIGEATYGAGRGARRMAYLTIGTGVGAGILIDGDPVLGAGYPEVAHLNVKRHAGDGFVGVCPFHGDCAEGLMSGPAITARFGPEGTQLDQQTAQFANDLVAFYAAQVISTLTFTLGISCVVVGGGVTKRAGAVAAIRAHTQRAVAAGGGINHVDIRGSELGDTAGALGALQLARNVSSRSGR